MIYSVPAEHESSLKLTLIFKQNVVSILILTISLAQRFALPALDVEGMGSISIGASSLGNESF